MGTWGINNFENDDASDWVILLEQSKGLDILLAPLNKISEQSGYIEAANCSQALAAAEIISASLSKDFSNIPETAKNWLEKKPGLFRKKPEILDSHAELAKEVVLKIMLSSELQELWEESDQYKEWKTLINNLFFSLN